MATESQRRQRGADASPADFGKTGTVRDPHRATVTIASLEINIYGATVTDDNCCGTDSFTNAHNDGRVTVCVTRASHHAICYWFEHGARRLAVAHGAPSSTPMVTRARVGTFKPNPRYAATATTSTPSPIPRTVHQALQDPNWTKAMQSEFNALIANNTWELVPRPPRAHIVSGKWIFLHKFKEDGSFDRYKARWVVRVFTQRAGVDYGETYCPVVKPATVRTVLHLAAQRGWPVHQLDVNNAFFHGVLDEQVYACQPAGFTTNPDLVCRLSKSLYGLKQAPRAWYMCLASFLGSMGFRLTRSDSSLFVLCQGKESVYLLLYVDDIVLTASSNDILRHVIRTIHNEFVLKDMGPLHFFLGIQVTRRLDGFHLHQQQYAQDLLDRAGMADCRPSNTPVDTSGKVSENDGTPLSTADASDYCNIVGALKYLTMTRPDLQYAVQQACLHMHALTTTH